MSGYPRFDGDRFRRTPYEDNAMRALDRFGDPFASRSRDPFVRESIERQRDPFRREERLAPGSGAFGRPPVITLNEPMEQQRRSHPAFEPPGQYGRFLRLSETPPERPSRNRIDRFGDVFGGYGRPGKPSLKRSRHEMQPY